MATPDLPDASKGYDKKRESLGKLAILDTSDGKAYSYNAAGYKNLANTKTYPLTSYHWLPEAIHDGKGFNGAKFWGDSIHNILHDRATLINTVPRLNIVSMYPETALGSLGKVLQQLFELGDTVSDKISKLGPSKAGEAIFGVFKPADRALGTVFYGNPKKGNADVALMFPAFVYANLIGGVYTNAFEIPLLHGSDTVYLNNGAAGNGWTRNDIWASLPGGSILQSFSEALIPEVGLIGRPTYKPNGGQGDGQSFSAEFPLFNSNIDMLNANFEFITKLAGETMWFQSGMLQRGSNLFDVHAEGKFHYHFCTCDITVDFVGKSRILGPAISATTGTLKQFLDTHKSNESARFTFPDAYNVKLEFKSLAPVNFNTFMSYMKGDKFKRGAFQGVIGNQAYSMFTTMISNVIEAIKAAPQEPAK